MPSEPDSTVKLAEVVDPPSTAVVTMEMQRGVVGDLATFADLARVVEETDLVARVAKVVDAARPVGVMVVHATAEMRSDRAGTSLNTPLLASAARRPGQILRGTAAVDLVQELGPEPTDLVSSRLHGVSPFSGTELDSLLRNAGVQTVVPAGVSLNVGVLGLCIEAANLGYRVVLPTDCVAGVPIEYGEEVIANTLSLLATLTTADELLESWGR